MSAGKTYSAGTIFLQVVPVFKDVQRAIKSQADDINKSLGDELEKGGEDAGQRMGDGISKGLKGKGKQDGQEYAGAFRQELTRAVAGMERELKPIKVKVKADGDIAREFAEIKSEFAALSKDLELKPGMNAKKVYAELAILETRLKGLQADSTDIEFKTNLDAVQKRLDVFLARARSTMPDIEIPVHIDDKNLNRELGALERKLRSSAKRAASAFGEPISQEISEIKAKLQDIGDVDIHADFNADSAIREIEELVLRVRRASSESVDIDAKVQGAAAEGELLGLLALVKEIDGNKIRIPVDVDDNGAESKIAALRAAMLGAGSGGENASNAFRSFNAVILAVVTILPALIPMIGALGGALLALLPVAGAVGAGLGTMLIGFSGISAAVTAMGAKTKKSASDTATAAHTIQAALFAVRDAQEGVEDAERSAGRASADAARQVAQAKQQAARAISDALEQQRAAQDDYAQSVKDVADAEKALNEARQQAKEDRADLKNQIADNKLSIRSAVLDAFNATNDLNAVNADGSSTTYDKAQAKLAFDQAQQRLKDLRQQQKELEREQKKQQKEGINGVDQVKQANDALTSALNRQKDAQRALGDAAKRVNRARIDGARSIADAERSASRAQSDGARSVAKAQDALTRAQQNYQYALKKNGEIGSSSVQNLRDAMSKLGPEGQAFARFIFSLQKGFYKLREDIQAAMLPPIQHAIEHIVGKYGPQLDAFLTRMGRVSGRFLAGMIKSLESPVFQQFFRVMSRLAPVMAKVFGQTFIVWMKIFARLMAITAPFGVQLSKGLLGVAQAILKWEKGKKGTKTIQDFMTYAFKIGPSVIAFLKNLIGAAINLARALAPWGGIVLKVLGGFLSLIKQMNPKDLGLITSAMIGLFIAFQVGVGSISLLLGGLALIANPLGLLIAAVVAAVVIFTALYVRFKLVRQITALYVKGLILIYGTIFKIDKFIVLLVLHLVELGAKLLHLKQLWDVTFSFIKRVTPPIIRAITDAMGWLGDAAKTAWEGYIKPALEAIGAAISWLWKHTAQPILGAIGAAFRVMGHVIKKIWDGFIFPVLDLYIHIWLKLGQKVFLPLAKLMWLAFTHLGNLVHAAWVHLIRPALGALGDAMSYLNKRIFHPASVAMGAAWGVFATGMKYVYDHTLKPVIDAFVDLMGGPDGLRSKFHTVVEALKDMWDGLKKAFAAPIKFVLDTVINHGVIAGFNKIANFVGSKPMSTIKIPSAINNAYAKGGVLPGYFPGGDNHHFTSPTAGRLSLSGGEAIMRPEFTSAVGSGWVDRMNQAARNGGSRAVKKFLNMSAGHFFSDGGIFGGRFAKGGVLQNPDKKVTMDGKYIAAIAAAQVLLAEKLRGVDYYLMQGGFGGDHIAASGTSHNYPGVADVSRAGGVSFADQAALRKVAFAAWARNIPGAAYVGSGEHVHSASLLSPGTARSPQITGSWPGHTDGLAGGPDYGPRPPWIDGLYSKLGNFDLSKIDAGGQGNHGFGLPGWLLKVAKNPIGYVTDLVTKPIHAMYDKFGQNQYVKEMAGIPLQLVKKTAEKVIDMIPGGGAIMKAAGWTFDKVNDVGHFLGNGAHNVASGISDAGHTIGDVLGFAKGGVLPYNGTMMYDAGGYLPPGLTQVVNLTGRPEPVLTGDQFDRMAKPDGKGGPLVGQMNFNGTDLTAADVMDEFEYTMRKMGRSTGRGPNAGGGGR